MALSCASLPFALSNRHSRPSLPFPLPQVDKSIPLDLLAAAPLKPIEERSLQWGGIGMRSFNYKLGSFRAKWAETSTWSAGFSRPMAFICWLGIKLAPSPASSVPLLDGRRGEARRGEGLGRRLPLASNGSRALAAYANPASPVGKVEPRTGNEVAAWVARRKEVEARGPQIGRLVALEPLVLGWPTEA